MTIGPPPICDACARLTMNDQDRLSCEAFPDGIPESIIFDGFDHRQPHPGDNGVQFVLADGAEARLAAYVEEL